MSIFNQDIKQTYSNGNRLRMSENKVLKRLFGPKRDEMAGGWRKLHNGGLHNLYSSPCLIRMIMSRMGRACGTNEGEEECI
jgi:hypothetical protein